MELTDICLLIFIITGIAISMVNIVGLYVTRNSNRIYANKTLEIIDIDLKEKIINKFNDDMGASMDKNCFISYDVSDNKQNN